VISPLTWIVDDPALFAAFVVGVLVCFSLHEFSHAAVATLQGDPTARRHGRLTLNPIKHIDPFGALLLLFAGFGYAKPVPFTPALLRSRRFGAAMVGLAGPAMNFLLAFVTAFVLRTGLVTDELTFRFVWVFFILNVILGVFNLLPIPPLDGSRVLAAALPPSRQGIIFFLDRYGIYLLLALVLLPALSGFHWLSPIVQGVQRQILQLVGFDEAFLRLVGL
jgi:Zn-dependent protease